MNDPTPAFAAALAALRYGKHIVEYSRSRQFGASLQGYNAAFVSLGDPDHPSARRVKLAMVKAAIGLPTCLFLDRPLVGGAAQFWASGLFSESRTDTAGAVQHRGEMTQAMRSDWRTTIETKLADWEMGLDASASVVPAFDFLGVSNGWEPTAFHITPIPPIQKTIPHLDAFDDDLPVDQIAAASVVTRRRAVGESRPKWSPLPVLCARMRTVYLDDEPIAPFEYPLDRGDQNERDAVHVSQRAAYVDKRTQVDAAAKLTKALNTAIRRSGR